MKIAAIVILYFPEPETLSNIASYINHVDKVFIYDNSPTCSFLHNKLPSSEKIDYAHDTLNQGIAIRLNDGMRKAVAEQYDWVLTMDQDSFFEPDMIERYLICLQGYANKQEVAMFGTQYGRQQKTFSAQCQPEQIHELITSGTIINVDVFKIVGEFDEALFIDSVDHDYCIRCKQYGFLLIQFANIFLTHALGKLVKASSIKTLFLAKKKKFIHNPIRCYYMYRNLLYLEQKFKNQSAELLVSVRSTALSSIRNSIFYGRYTVRIAQYLIAAQSDFKKGIMGKCTHRF